jgi:hypothetical protein
LAFIPDLLTASVNHLRVLFPTFSSYYLLATETPPTTSEDDPVELPQLLCPIIDFQSSIIQSGKSRGWLSAENLSNLISSVLVYVQMTDDDVSFLPKKFVLFLSKSRSKRGQIIQTSSLHKRRTKLRVIVSEWQDLIYCRYDCLCLPEVPYLVFTY